MIEVSITPDEQARTVQPLAQYVKERLKSAGVPVVVDTMPGMRFTEPGHLHCDFTHTTVVYQWVPAVDTLAFDDLPEPLMGVGLLAHDDFTARAHG